MPFSNYWRNHLLGHAFNKEVFAPLDVYCVGLSSAEPLRDASGLAEPSGGGYVRIATSASDWTDVSGGDIHNLDTIYLAEATVNWGWVYYFVLFDALTGGNMLVYGALTAGVDISAGDIKKFNANDLAVSLA